MSQLLRWFKNHEKELWDYVDLRGISHTRPTLTQLTILKLIGIGSLKLSIGKEKRVSMTDLVRDKLALASDDDEYCYCYENDSLRNQLSWLVCGMGKH